jgi:hypothetical protein
MGREVFNFHPNSIQIPFNFRSTSTHPFLTPPPPHLQVLEGKTPDEYSLWILNPEKWGGEIELSVLHAALKVSN